MIKQTVFFLIFTFVLSGCTFVQLPSDEQELWKTYTNETLGFSMNVPTQILSDYLDESSLSTLLIFEDENHVYFTSHPLEQTLQDESWDFRVGGGTLNNKDEAVDFLESYYRVDGCEVEFHENEVTGFLALVIFPIDTTLMPDDPASCGISGKVRIFYDEISGKLITYQLIESFFYIQGGNVSDESLASLEFSP
jgi:hypothetical protein